MHKFAYEYDPSLTVLGWPCVVDSTLKSIYQLISVYVTVTWRGVGGLVGSVYVYSSFSGGGWL